MKNNMINTPKIKVTKQGLNSLKNELDDLKNNKRPKIVDRLTFARSQGDLSENSDYQNAKDELEFLDGRISELEEVVKHTQVISSPTGGSEVSFGTKVTVSSNGEKYIYEIVGEWEADPTNKKISHSSPLGQKLIGKKVGEKIDVEAPAGKITYKVLAID